jgi:hypothetical protein
MPAWLHRCLPAHELAHDWPAVPTTQPPNNVFVVFEVIEIVVLRRLAAVLVESGNIVEAAPERVVLIVVRVLVVVRVVVVARVVVVRVDVVARVVVEVAAAVTVEADVQVVAITSAIKDHKIEQMEDSLLMQI